MFFRHPGVYHVRNTVTVGHYGRSCPRALGDTRSGPRENHPLGPGSGVASIVERPQVHSTMGRILRCLQARGEREREEREKETAEDPGICSISLHTVPT